MTYMRWVYTTMAIVLFSSCGSNDKSIKTEKISNYVQNGGVELSEQDYLDAGISGVRVENLTPVHATVAGFGRYKHMKEIVIRLVTNLLI